MIFFDRHFTSSPCDEAAGEPFAGSSQDSYLMVGRMSIGLMPVKEGRQSSAASASKAVDEEIEIGVRHVMRIQIAIFAKPPGYSIEGAE